MNIFILDDNLVKSASMLADQHLGKQILEIAQMICTVLHTKGHDVPYKPTHRNHPVTKWVSNNLLYVIEYGLVCHNEYIKRFNKTHKSGELLEELYCADDWVRQFDITEFPIPNDLEYYNTKLQDTSKVRWKITLKLDK